MKYHAASVSLCEHTMEKRGFNPSELSRALHRSTSTVDRYVKGERALPAHILRSLARLCGYRSVAELCQHAL